MERDKIVEMLATLPEDKQVEVVDFIRFLKYQDARDRILASDKEERVDLNGVDDLMDAIDNAN